MANSAFWKPEVQFSSWIHEKQALSARPPMARARHGLAADSDRAIHTIAAHRLAASTTLAASVKTLRPPNQRISAQKIGREKIKRCSECCDQRADGKFSR